MFDSDINIDDEMLQELLSASTSDKMKNIVATIQIEQNQVIRNETNKLLVVNGAAGSGKTSIALHRIAWYLYRYRDSGISSKNVLILSPNAMFSDYISNVLPELGEENVWQTTLYSMMAKIVGESFRIVTPAAEMRSIMNEGIKKSAADIVRFKTSDDFAALVKAYCEELQQKGIPFEDIYHRDFLIISATELRELYENHLSASPVAARISRIKAITENRLKLVQKQRYNEHLQELEREDPNDDHKEANARMRNYHEFLPVRNRIDALLNFSVANAYKDLYKPAFLNSRLGDSYPKSFIKQLSSSMLRFLGNGILPYEDASAYLYVFGYLNGSNAYRLTNQDEQRSDIRHMVIDEAQDYSPMDYMMLSMLFPGIRFTVLGDYNQLINPCRQACSYETIQTIFKEPTSSLISLKRCYRSSLPITRFTSALIGSTDLIPVERDGEPVVHRGFDDKESLYTACAELIRQKLSAGYKSVGLLVKNEEEAEYLNTVLDKRILRRIITESTEEYHSGVLISPCYLIKGLEFDLVITTCVDKENFPDDFKKKLLYTMTSRALHSLCIFYTGEPCPMVEKGLESAEAKH